MIYFKSMFHQITYIVLFFLAAYAIVTAILKLLNKNQALARVDSSLLSDEDKKKINHIVGIIRLVMFVTFLVGGLLILFIDTDVITFVAIGLAVLVAIVDIVISTILIKKYVKKPEAR